MDSRAWDERYAASDLAWSAGPNGYVAEVAGALAPGRALDVAAGEGRNAIWLAERGWSVVATDFSPVAVERMARLAQERLGERSGALTARVADATAPAPGVEGGVDLVVVCYLQLAEEPWRAALASAVEAAAPGGLVLVILHARRNITEGVGGPQDPAVCHDPDDVVAAVRALPVTVESAQLRTRVVEQEGGPREALDTVVVVRRMDA